MKRNAFTLIELLVVVAIIGILAAVGVTTFNGFQEKAKASAAKAVHKSIVNYVAAELVKCNFDQKIFEEKNKTKLLLPFRLLGFAVNLSLNLIQNLVMLPFRLIR